MHHITTVAAVVVLRLPLQVRFQVRPLVVLELHHQLLVQVLVAPAVVAVVLIQVQQEAQLMAAAQVAQVVLLAQMELQILAVAVVAVVQDQRAMAAQAVLVLLFLDMQTLEL
jgi:hypothetical protein